VPTPASQINELRINGDTTMQKRQACPARIPVACQTFCGHADRGLAMIPASESREEGNPILSCRQPAKPCPRRHREHANYAARILPRKALTSRRMSSNLPRIAAECCWTSRAERSVPLTERATSPIVRVIARVCSAVTVVFRLISEVAAFCSSTEAAMVAADSSRPLIETEIARTASTAASVAVRNFG
jgi:hypothetical protein